MSNAWWATVVLLGLAFVGVLLAWMITSQIDQVNSGKAAVDEMGCDQLLGYILTEEPTVSVREHASKKYLLECHDG